MAVARDGFAGDDEHHVMTRKREVLLANENENDRMRVKESKAPFDVIQHFTLTFFHLKQTTTKLFKNIYFTPR